VVKNSAVRELIVSSRFQDVSVLESRLDSGGIGAELAEKLMAVRLCGYTAKADNPAASVVAKAVQAAQWW